MGEAVTAWEYFVAPLLEHNPGEILDTFGARRLGVGVRRGASPHPRVGVSTVAYLKRPKG